jgi:hypothetical protein
MAIELKTYGDLKKAIKSIALKQKGEKVGGVALDTIIGLVPGLDVARTTFDFIKAAVSKPDVKKTKTWLDRLDVDDEMSAIVDDTVENGFMKTIAQTIDSEPDDKPLEPDFNMNARMVNYLQDKYQGRHIAGIKESKMDKDKLSQIKKGIEVEMEHTDDPKVALKIALDHIKEDPKYYDKLIKAGLEETPAETPKFKIGDTVKWENQDWEVEGIRANGEYKLKSLKGLPSTNISIRVIDSQNKHNNIEELNEGEFCPQCLAQYIKDHINTLHEAEYKGRKVQLGKPMAGDVKKFKVYVKNAKGNVVKVNFGQKGVKIKKGNPKRRKSFRARHHCDTNPGPRWKARYWSCRKW